MEAIELRYRPFQFNDDELYEFCQQNGDLKLERDASEIIIAMPDTGGETGIRNAELIFRLQVWNNQYRLGRGFDSSTAFRLPSSAVRSADAAFVAPDRWNTLTADERTRFLPLYPNFIIELVSESDRVNDVRAEVANDWMASSCQLTWLVDPKSEITCIYRADGSIQINRSFDQPLADEDVLPGFGSIYPPYATKCVRSYPPFSG